MAYSATAVERAMTYQQVIMRALAGSLTWLQAADILGLEPRSLRRWRKRYEEDPVLFVAVNCGAVTETLLESELFGHVRGAFTGAIATRKGLFEEAHAGTLFLDEIGEMTPALQVKVLRALQDGEIRPVGSTQAVTIDVRVLAATHRDLEQMIREGTFREDLF